MIVQVNETHVPVSRPLTVKELAERWQCSDGHIYNMIKSRQLPHFKIGQLIRIAASQVEKIECALPSIAENGPPPANTPTRERSGGGPWVQPIVPSPSAASAISSSKRRATRPRMQ